MFVWIFLSIPAVSAIVEDDEFTIIKDSTENCKLCYGFDCTTLSKPRCKYYDEVYGSYANIDDYEPEDNDLNDEVGNMLLQYVDKASMKPYEDCLPLISQYTTCNKENICIECKICSCDVYGRWNCSSVQRCLNNDRLIADHRTLVVVMEKLRRYKSLHSNERFKRSTNEINQDSKISYEDLLKWLYGTEGFENVAQNKSEMSIKKTNINKNNDISKKQTSHHNSDSDLLSFNDLLNSAMADDNLDTNTNHTETIFYKSNDPISFDLLKEIGVYYDTEANGKNIPDEKPENKTTSSLKTVFTNIRENENAIFSLNDMKENINIKKRDIPSDANVTDVHLPINYNKTIDKMEELQSNVVFSLSKIVNEKQNELENLTNIKEKLILYLKSFGNISIPNVKSNDSKYNENPIIHLYQFEANQPNEDLRKHDPNILEKYLKKLKRDIYEVIRDIAGIQRLPNTSIPHDLSLLVRSMKYYVNEENKKANKTKHNKVINFRKQFNSHDTNESNNRLVDIIINILEVLDKDAPTSDVLINVSPNLRRILKRLIARFYSEDFDISDTKVFNPKYNILSYLTSIENKWQNLILEIGQSSIQEHLYNLKSLHIALSKDILKINNALKFVEFANNRRMATNGQVLGEKVVFKLANNLHEMKNRIKQIIKSNPSQRFKNKNKTVSAIKKKSIFQKIKKMLKTSKKELRKLFHKNVTKAEVVRHMARKKMDEMNKKKMSEYEEIMQRWQNNLNIMSVRNKRSAGGFRKFMYKIKHFFAPRYSRSRAKTTKPINNKNGSKGNTKKIKHRGHSKNKKVVSTTSKNVLFKKIKHNN